MSGIYILKIVPATADRTPLYLSGIRRSGLQALFERDVAAAQRFKADDIREHRIKYAHIKGRFVLLDKERKRIAKVAPAASGDNP